MKTHTPYMREKTNELKKATNKEEIKKIKEEIAKQTADKKLRYANPIKNLEHIITHIQNRINPENEIKEILNKNSSLKRLYQDYDNNFDMLLSPEKLDQEANKLREQLKAIDELILKLSQPTVSLWNQALKILSSESFRDFQEDPINVEHNFFFLLMSHTKFFAEEPKDWFKSFNQALLNPEDNFLKKAGFDDLFIRNIHTMLKEKLGSEYEEPKRKISLSTTSSTTALLAGLQAPARVTAAALAPLRRGRGRLDVHSSTERRSSSESVSRSESRDESTLVATAPAAAAYIIDDGKKNGPTTSREIKSKATSSAAAATEFSALPNGTTANGKPIKKPNRRLTLASDTPLPPATSPKSIVEQQEEDRRTRFKRAGERTVQSTRSANTPKNPKQ